MKLTHNIILNTDSYKISMPMQYPPDTTGVYSYIESRGGRWDSTLFFGLQMFIKEYLLKPVTMDDVNIAEDLWTAHGEPFYRNGWEYIVREHNGKLPVVIKAVPEGTLVPVHNVLMTIENTDRKCWWLTTHLETMLLRAVWYPTTVATQSYMIKQVIKEYLETTGDVSGLLFKLHNFGARGVSSMESAGIGGAAHLVNFMGTDTMTGVLYAREYYNAGYKSHDGIAGFSVPAAEHSTITSWGRDDEAKAYANMLKLFAHEGKVVAVVSDSYDIYNAAENLWGGELKQKVIDSGATVVIRPDSGDPVVVNRKLMQILDAKFGHTVNNKGYKVLNNVRVIQGDGVNELTIRSILGAITSIGYSADNIGFGMGGALLQQVDRDTQKFAMKCSAIERGKVDYYGKLEGGWHNVQKDPVTDPGKRSKAGRVTLYKNAEGEFYSGVEEWMPSELRAVYMNGELIKDFSFDEVRKNGGF